MSEQQQVKGVRYGSAMRHPESSRLAGNPERTAAEETQRQDHVMQAILLLLKELEPGELDLIRHDVDTRIQHNKSNNARAI